MYIISPGLVLILVIYLSRYWSLILLSSQTSQGRMDNGVVETVSTMMFYDLKVVLFTLWTRLCFIR